MESAEFVEKAQSCLKQIDDLRKERQAIGSPVVKAWKTEVEQLLKAGGKNTSKLLQNFQNMRFGASAMGAEAIAGDQVKFQAYQAELDAAEKLLKSAIQTIQIFGISEGPKLPDWVKQEVKASGTIRLGGKEVDIKTVTVHEFLSAIVQLSESDGSLDESLKKEMSQRLEALKKHPLLSPFLNQTIDKVFSKLS
ncbi:MAG TPA: hypothetical protein VLH08_07875 [Acidobacteriota bacterium]|nr:hypothetical protein [Acidobacteriota bacterium]